MRYRSIVAYSAVTLAFSGFSCPRPNQAPWASVGQASLVLPGVKVVSGHHCESSAMLNALLYEGYEVTEDMIIGGGSAPSFIFIKGVFPFVGGRCDEMRQRFFSAAMIDWHGAIPRAKDADWPLIASLLRQGLPVVLRVDMRYLPYRYGGRYGSRYMSFGGHYVTLFGIDPGAGIAYVSDTEYQGLQGIKLSDLHKARTSTTKTFPPKAEYYWAGAPGQAQISAEALVRASFARLIDNYEQQALNGLATYGADLAAIESYSKPVFLLPSVFGYMAGNIEDFGTGGASFRMPYRDFLQFAAERSPYSAQAKALIPDLELCIEAWHQLASAFRLLSSGIKAMDKNARKAEYAKLTAMANTLYEREKSFYTALKKAYGEMTGG